MNLFCKVVSFKDQRIFSFHDFIKTRLLFLQKVIIIIIEFVINSTYRKYK